MTIALGLIADDETHMIGLSLVLGQLKETTQSRFAIAFRVVN